MSTSHHRTSIMINYLVLVLQQQRKAQGMSKFMHQIAKPENSSLRKYEKPPTKRVKYDPFTKNSQIRSHKSSNSPFCHNHAAIQKDKISRGLQNPKQILSPAHHIISQSKTIKLSKRKNSNDAGSNHQDNLQKKIYQSLLNSHRKLSKYDNSIGSCSSMEEDVYLNDFQREGEMEEQKHNQDANFNNIQIKQKLEAHLESPQQNICLIAEAVSENKQINDYKLTDQQITKDQTYHSQCENVAQASQQRCEPQPIYYKNELLQTQYQKIDNPQSVEMSNLSQPLHKIQEMPIFLQQTCNLMPHQHFEQSESNSFISLPNDFPTDKCMAFQGGRICIKCPEQQYLISVRVFNRLHTQFADLDQLIGIVIQQRPYLQSIKTKLKEELKKYYKNYD